MELLVDKSFLQLFIFQFELVDLLKVAVGVELLHVAQVFALQVFVFHLEFCDNICVGVVDAFKLFLQLVNLLIFLHQLLLQAVKLALQ